MYHLILLMPLIGLGLFWLLPFAFALPLYLVVLLLSGYIYFVMVRAMRRPVETGAQALVGKSADVVEADVHGLEVRVEGATWQAISEGPLRKGDKVRVVGVDGLTLRVKAGSSGDEQEKVGADRR
jgi:membrane-bound serine protease (ClpP class)